MKLITTAVCLSLSTVSFANNYNVNDYFTMIDTSVGAPVLTVGAQVENADLYSPECNNRNNYAGSFDFKCFTDEPNWPPHYIQTDTEIFVRNDKTHQSCSIKVPFIANGNNPIMHHCYAIQLIMKNNNYKCHYYHYSTTC